MPRSPRLDLAGVAQNVIQVEMIGKPASSGRPEATVCVTRVSDMSCDGSSFQIALCIKGDELSPDELSEAIGAAPTRSHFKGHAWSTSSGRQVTEKTGVWVLEMRGDDSESFPELVSRFGKRLAGACAGLETLLGVEVAYLDVLVLKNMI